MRGVGEMRARWNVDDAGRDGSTPGSGFKANVAESEAVIPDVSNSNIKQRWLGTHRRVTKPVAGKVSQAIQAARAGRTKAMRIIMVLISEVNGGDGANTNVSLSCGFSTSQSQ